MTTTPTPGSREKTLTETVEELRDLFPLTDWAKIKDPWAELHRIRHGKDPDCPLHGKKDETE